MRVKCAWCDVLLIDADTEKLSHGICPRCLKEHCQEAGLPLPPSSLQPPQQQ
jgi:hypothetical protein